MRTFTLITLIGLSAACSKSGLDAHNASEASTEPDRPSGPSGAVSPNNQEAEQPGSGSDTQPSDEYVACEQDAEVTYFNGSYYETSSYFEVAEVSTHFEVELVGNDEIDISEGDSVEFNFAVDAADSCNAPELYCFEVSIYDAPGSMHENFAYWSDLNSGIATLDDHATGEDFQATDEYNTFDYSFCANSEVTWWCNNMEPRELASGERREFTMTFPVVRDVPANSALNIRLTRVQWIDASGTNHYVYTDTTTQLTVNVTD